MYREVRDPDCNWANTIYSGADEILPIHALEPLEKPVTLTTYVDSNLYHGMISECSASGILHLINKTTFDLYSKKQSTVETATYDSDSVAAKISTDHIIEHHIILCVRNDVQTHIKV